MNNAYCTCTMPETYKAYINNWENFAETGEELVFLSDNSKDVDFDIGVTYTEQKLRDVLKFNKQVSNKHYWNSTGNRNIVWFYAHFRMMYYYIANPDFDYYWFFDDDIRLSDWNELLNGYINADHDFLSYFIFKNENISSQSEVPVIDSNTFSGTGWFNRFPGDGDVLPEEVNDYFGSFFPIVRYSRDAMKYLLELHQSGYDGYSEGFVPTMLNHNNMKLASIINPSGGSSYFDTKIANIKHKNMTIEWKWI